MDWKILCMLICCMVWLIITWRLLFLHVLIYAPSSYEHLKHLVENNYTDIYLLDNKTDKWIAFDAILCNVRNSDEIGCFNGFEIPFIHTHIIWPIWHGPYHMIWKILIYHMTRFSIYGLYDMVNTIWTLWYMCHNKAILYKGELW